MQKFVKKLTGFTLAEVLITLLIIGVISSLLIPAIIQDTQEAEFKVAWKKAYANIDQTIRMIMLDNGNSLLGVFTANNNSINIAFSNYLNISKNCNISFQGNGNCWHSNFTWKYLNGSSVSSFYDSKTGMILNNGILLGFWTENTAQNCDVGTIQSCGKIMLDVNGFKQPNTFGKDIFAIHITKHGIKPYGVKDDGYDTTCISTNTGLGCSAKYLSQ
jgi:prepilin-type N-terminal cleavage/methylation domain-containing protein